MKLQNELGEIRISADVFTAITGSAATNCYGVKGMAVRSKTDGLVHLLKRESMAKGVKVYYNEDGTYGFSFVYTSESPDYEYTFRVEQE